MRARNNTGNRGHGTKKHALSALALSRPACSDPTSRGILKTVLAPVSRSLCTQFQNQHFCLCSRKAVQQKSSTTPGKSHVRRAMKKKQDADAGRATTRCVPNCHTFPRKTTNATSITSTPRKIKGAHVLLQRFGRPGVKVRKKHREKKTLSRPPPPLFFTLPRISEKNTQRSASQ